MVPAGSNTDSVASQSARMDGVASQRASVVASSKHFMGLLIWGKFIIRFLDGKVWEVRKTQPQQGIVPGVKVTLIESRTSLSDPTSGKNLWRICFTVTFEGFEAVAEDDFPGHYGKHRVTSEELRAYILHGGERKRKRSGPTIYFWKFKDVQLVEPAQYLASDSRVTWVKYSLTDVFTETPRGTSVFSCR